MIYLLTKPRELPTGTCFRHEKVAKAFLVVTSGPKGQVEFWQNTIGEFSIFAFRFGNHPRSSSFYFSELAQSLVPATDVPSS